VSDKECAVLAYTRLRTLSFDVSSLVSKGADDEHDEQTVRADLRPTIDRLDSKTLDLVVTYTLAGDSSPAVEAVIDARYVLREQLSEDDVSDMMSELTAPVYHLCCYWVAFLTREAGPYPIIMCPYSDEPDLGDDDDGTDDAH